MASEPGRAFVYVSNADSRELAVLLLDLASGELQLIQHVLGARFTAQAVMPKRQWLFAALRDEPCALASFALDPFTGKLKFIAETRMPGELAFMSVDRSGQWLFGASYHNDLIVVSRIDADGVAHEPHQVLSGLPKAHAVLADPANRFVGAALTGADMLMFWPFDAESGRLHEQHASSTMLPEGVGPRHFRFHPHTSRLYVLNELNGSIHAFDYDAARGHARELGVASSLPRGFRGKPWAAELHCTPDGRFLFASERSSSTLAAFAVDPVNGALQALGSTSTEKQPRSFAIDPTGRYLLALGQKSNRLCVHAIDPTSGTLVKLPDYPMGDNPQWVEIVAGPDERNITIKTI